MSALHTDDRRAASGRPTVDDMGEWSFPASDPPATWNWEVEPAPVGDGGHDPGTPEGS